LLQDIQAVIEQLCAYDRHVGASLRLIQAIGAHCWSGA